MRNIFKAIRQKWLDFWDDDEKDADKHHLSQYDKRSIMEGNFFVGAAIVALVSIGIFAGVAWNNYKSEKETEEIFNFLATYLATATDDEYEEIAQEIRHDLVYSAYGQDIDNLIEYVPNTSEQCCLERDDGFINRMNVIFLNTGEAYGLDVYDTIEPVSVQQGYSGICMTSGYDEISESTVSITSDRTEGTATATLDRGRGIVSVHRMKETFCDDCIQKILEVTDGELVSTAVLYDSEERRFYPVTDGTLELGDYKYEIKYDDGNYTIDILYVR